MLRTQLPTYSPISLWAWARGLGAGVFRPERAEERLRSFLTSDFGAEEVILTDSGTHALELALRLGVGRRPKAGPVAFPAYSCFDLATAAVGADVPVRFYDVDPRYLTPDLVQIDKALQGGTEVVVISNLFGYPVDWDAVRTLCDQGGALIIEDAAQGLGSSWRGRPAGSFGDMTVLSFGRGKGWTGGSGGALLVRNQERVGSVQSLSAPSPPGLGRAARACVFSLAQWALGRPFLYGLPSALPWLGLGETSYKEPSEVKGIIPFSAGLTSATRDSSLAEIEKRRSTAVTLRGLISSGLRPGVGRFPSPLGGGEASFLRLPVLVSGGADAFLASRKVRRWGVARGYHTALPRLPQLKGLSGQPSDGTPGADLLARELVTLPTHSLLTRADLDRIVALFS